MTAFADALKGVAARVPESELLMIIGTDGIPIEKLTLRADPNMEGRRGRAHDAAAREPRGAVRHGARSAARAGHHTERLTTLLVAITPEYFLFASLAPGAVMGRARFALRWRASRSSASSSNNLALRDGPPIIQGGRVNLLDLKEILQILEERDITEFEMEQGGVKLRVCRGAGRSPRSRRLRRGDPDPRGSPVSAAVASALPASRRPPRRPCCAGTGAPAAEGTLVPQPDRRDVLSIARSELAAFVSVGDT
jgi:hypothetical protein